MDLEKERERLLLFAEFFDNADMLSLSELNVLNDIYERSKVDKEINQLLLAIESIQNIEGRKLLVEEYLKEKGATLGIEQPYMTNQKKMLLFRPLFKSNKKAGFVDALLFALITGFSGGVITALMLKIIL